MSLICGHSPGIPLGIQGAIHTIFTCKCLSVWRENLSVFFQVLVGLETSAFFLNPNNH